MNVTDRVAVTVLLPKPLAGALRDAARAAGRLTEEGAVVLDHLLLVKPEKAFEGPSKPLLLALQGWSRFLWWGRSAGGRSGAAIPRSGEPKSTVLKRRGAGVLISNVPGLFKQRG